MTGVAMGASFLEDCCGLPSVELKLARPFSHLKPDSYTWFRNMQGHRILLLGLALFYLHTGCREFLSKPETLQRSAKYKTARFSQIIIKFLKHVFFVWESATKFLSDDVRPKGTHHPCGQIQSWFNCKTLAFQSIFAVVTGGFELPKKGYARIELRLQVSFFPNA